MPRLLHVWVEAIDALNGFVTLDFDHFSEQCFGALGCAPAQMALAALGAHQDTGPGQAEPF